MNSTRKLPSPALLLAMIALVAALAGTAIAADPAAKLNKSKVKKIADKRIDKAAPNLTVGNATSANSSRIATNVLSANVLETGALLGSIPSGFTSSRTNVGTYEVVFPRSIAGCTLSASAGAPTSPTPVLVGAAPKPNVPNTVVVFTRTAANVVADEDFYVQAICPAG